MLSTYLQRKLAQAAVTEPGEFAPGIPIKRELGTTEALRPGAIVRDLDLRRPIYRPTAAYGHFGRDDIDAPWERTDKVDALRAEAGLPAQASVEAGS